MNTSEETYKIEKAANDFETIKRTGKRQRVFIFIGILVILIISVLFVLLLIMYRRGIKTNRLLREQNEEIIKQRTKIQGQRDKLSELAFELKKSNKTKDKFFSVLAHDLKNPFQSLCGFSELLMQQNKVGDYSNAQKFSEVIHETSYNTYILLENFLNWARVQTGVLKYHPEVLSLLEIVNESIEINRYTSDIKQISIRSKIDGTEKIYADRYMIATTLRNLISNAVKYSKPGGEIVIDSKIEDDGYQSIRVKDFGVGMKPEVMSNLFKISNYSALGTQEEKGTGLGLIICKEFAILNKGDLFVSSVLGKGSTFTVKIPHTQTFN
jgi:signal transduction histidine kinase